MFSVRNCFQYDPFALLKQLMQVKDKNFLNTIFMERVKENTINYKEQASKSK